MFVALLHICIIYMRMYGSLECWLRSLEYFVIHMRAMHQASYQLYVITHHQHLPYYRTGSLPQIQFSVGTYAMYVAIPRIQ